MEERRVNQERERERVEERGEEAKRGGKLRKKRCDYREVGGEQARRWENWR